MSLTFNSRTDCLHQNPSAFAALGVVTARPVPAAECLDCAHTELTIAMNQSPSRPEMAWQVLCFMPAGLARPTGWRVMLLRDHDRARTTVVAETLAAAMLAAARHLNDRAYRLPLGERMPDDLAYVDERDEMADLPECGE